MKAIAATESPNVIVIFVDDQGYYDLGCYGATEVETPRIDAMAKEGILFEDYYAASPICSPSRAGLADWLLSSPCRQSHLGAPR
jgi:arylsulfatase A